MACCVLELARSCSRAGHRGHVHLESPRLSVAYVAPCCPMSAAVFLQESHVSETPIEVRAEGQRVSS